MVCECKYNPEVDIQEVDQFGWINLRDAFINGTIPGDAGVDDSSYNDIEDPSAILGKPRDVFDAIEKAHYITNHPAAKVTVKTEESAD